MHKSIRKSSVARWFTGCYINKEDSCFENKVFEVDHSTETEFENKLRGYPVNMNFKRKKPLKTNGASSKLGFTVLLDPMIHDQINGEKYDFQLKDFKNICFTSWFGCRRFRKG